VEDRLLEVPYVHVTFTLPHEFNGLCRCHPKTIYELFFQVVRKTLFELCADPQDIGGIPGITAVLHTWGSDLKHHVHIHCLVTYGGLDEQSGLWSWPKCKYGLIKYSKINSSYRSNFLEALKKWMQSDQHIDPVYHQSYEVLTKDLLKKSWVVNQQRPTANAEVINAYLSRYICRIGISDKRLHYDAQAGTVRLEYKDYRQQKQGEPAPLAYRNLDPLIAMQMILQHLLPPYFHRSRAYGLHHPGTRKRLSSSLQNWVRQSPGLIVVMIRLLKAVLAQTMYSCEGCGICAPLSKALVLPDRTYKESFLRPVHRPPPNKLKVGVG
jgi:hypothetical protein